MGKFEFTKKFTINSSMEGLKECFEIASGIQKQFHFESSKEFAFITVLSESVNNAIRHGNKFNKDFLTFVTIMIDDKKIEIEVEDQGDGFDLGKIPSPLDKDHINLESGRGIFFMQQLSSGLKTRGRGNIINITIDR